MGETETLVPVAGLSNRHTAGPSVGAAHPPLVGRRPPQHLLLCPENNLCPRHLTWQEGVCNSNKDYGPYEREGSLGGPGGVTLTN